MSNSPSPVAVTPLSRSLLGVWQLKTRTDIDPKGQPKLDPVLGRDPLGMLCFAGGHFAAQFMKRDRSSVTETSSAGPGTTNKTSAVNGYDAYFGKYTLNDAAETITVQLEGSVVPGNIGKYFDRKVRVVEDELTVQLSTTAADGTPVTRTLVFSRLG